MTILLFFSMKYDLAPAYQIIMEDPSTKSCDICAICNNGLDDRCMECGLYDTMKMPCQHSTHSNCDGHFINPITNEECTITGNACCDHMFHYSCISRWLKIRNICPLCMAPWIWSKELSLSEKIVAKWITHPEKILEYSIGDVDLGPKVDNFLLLHMPNHLRNLDMSQEKKKIISRMFAGELDVEYLEKLLSAKKEIAKKITKNK